MNSVLTHRPAFAAMLSRGWAASGTPSTCGLHPLVVPLARAEPSSCVGSGGVLGLLHWPLRKGRSEVVVSTNAQAVDDEVDIDSLTVRPLGTIAQYARRVAIETDAGGGDAELVRAASDACVEAGGKAYEPGEFAASKLKLPQFLLLKVGTGLPDVWAQLAQLQLERGDETAALVAVERGSANNPGWGCCLWEQAKLMGRLGRIEERRDLALAALEAPYWTLGAPVEEALRAANLEHVPDLRALMRQQEEQVRQQQLAPPRSTRELAELEVIELLDETVRTRGRWDDVRKPVAEALSRGAFEADAEIARGDGIATSTGGSAGGGAGGTGTTTATATSTAATAAAADAPDAPAAAPPEPLPEVELVRPGKGPVTFVSCSQCGAPTSAPLVCGVCRCISYCSAACRAKDPMTPQERADLARYAKRDVRVTLDGAHSSNAAEPAWLAAAMDHQADMPYSSVLEQMGVHDDEAYRLLSGCTGPPSPHRHLIEAIEGAHAFERPPRDWAGYYRGRGLPAASPLAVLLTFPLTVYHVLEQLELTDLERPLRVHLLGPASSEHPLSIP